MTRPDDEQSAAFGTLRPHLERVAYATLGSRAEAEDVVQEAWLRLQRTAPGEIRDLRAWATTVVGRLALDALGSARRRRETYIGPWLPEPIVTLHDPAGAPDPADLVTLDETVSFALLRVLETLSPAERTAFVLHDVFGLAFAEVAAVVGRSDTAVRQLAARARGHLRAGLPRTVAGTASRDERFGLIAAFARAAEEGDLEGLVAVLDPSVVWSSDGGGVVNAARKPLHGAERVARGLLALAKAHRRRDVAVQGALIDVNGEAGLMLQAAEERSVFAFTIAGGRITAIDVQRNPDKLERAPWLR